MRTITTLFFLVILFILPSFSSGQVEQNDSNDRQLVMVTTADGIQRIGYILSDDGREILLETKTLGKIFIEKSKITSIEPIKDGEINRADGKADFEIIGPFTTRYIFTTNALPIKKHENYSMLNLFGPEVHFAVNDRLSLGVMTTWIGSPIALAAKFSIPTKNKNINFGLGTIMGSSGYINSFRGFGGLHWGMMTLGNRRNNLTFSAGYLYLGGFEPDQVNKPGTYIVAANTYPAIDQESFKTMFTAPILGIGGIMELGSKTSLIIDAMYIVGSRDYHSSNTESELIDPNTMKYTVTANEVEHNSFNVFYLMPGIRYQKAPDRAFQFSVAGVVADGMSFPLPTCSWLRKF